MRSLQSSPCHVQLRAALIDMDGYRGSRLVFSVIDMSSTHDPGWIDRLANLPQPDHTLYCVRNVPLWREDASPRDSNAIAPLALYHRFALRTRVEYNKRTDIRTVIRCFQADFYPRTEVFYSP
ncbi:hypothetical protein J6590_058938 [Homalodisca vitripennis]|nr:hypothetical protein J6590_058938 [Homalodisca vitripennis]